MTSYKVTGVQGVQFPSFKSQSLDNAKKSALRQIGGGRRAIGTKKITSFELTSGNVVIARYTNGTWE